MSTEVTIKCDALDCCNQIDNNGTSDDVQELLSFNDWHNDPTTDEYHYCDTCWPAVQSEYAEMFENGEMA